MLPFYICDNLVRCHPILRILGRNIPQGIWNNHSRPHLVLRIRSTL